MSAQTSPITLPAEIMTDSQAFNRYMRDSMLSANKIECWYLSYKGMNIPVVAVMKDTPFMAEKRKEARKIGREQFSCTQCAENCDKLVSIIGKSKYMLCGHIENTTTYSEKLSSIADTVQYHANCNPESYFPQIATDRLLVKDKYDYVNPNNPCVDMSRRFLHYAGNCDTMPMDNFITTRNKDAGAEKHNDNVTDLKLLNCALDKYWVLMLRLLHKLSEDWALAGRRHATLQRIRTIHEVLREVTYAEEHFGKTLEWILVVLGGFTRPFGRENYSMKELVCHTANAIATGRFKLDGNGDNSVSHFQYAQMNNTVMNWMEKAISRSALKSMIVKDSGPNKGQRTKAVSVQQIDNAEKCIGSDFWTRIATTKTLEQFYGDSAESKFFWVSPHIRSTQMSGGAAGFKAIKAKAKNVQGSPARVCQWSTPSGNAESIPELIQLLVSGEIIYIQCNNNEHAILAHTSIDPQYMACVPVKGKGALMWTFMGGTGFGIHKSGHATWRKLIAIHHIKVGAFSNYILVCDTSRQLAPYVKNNPVMGDWTLSANAKRHMGPVFSKLKTTTHLSANTPMGYDAGNEYPIIGVGVCKGTNGLLAYGHTITYKLLRNSRVTKERTIAYYESRKPPSAVPCLSELLNKTAKFCGNCAAPRSTKPDPDNFCSNCGSSF